MSPPAFESLPTRRAVSLFLAFALAYFLSTLIRAITATLAPTLVQEFSLGAGDLGLLAGGYFFGFALTQLPLGRWLDRLGPKRVLLAFLAVAVLACLGFAAATSFSGLLAARTLCGVGVSACLMAPLTSYRRWYAPAMQMRANSWMLMTGALGMVASTLPVQWIMPLTGWRPLFVGLGLLLLLSMVLIAWAVPESSAQTQTRPQSDAQGEPAPVADTGYAQVWRDPFFRSLAPSGFVCYGGLVAVQTLWASPWMVKVAGYTQGEAAQGMFWLNLAMMLSYLAWGSVMPVFARRGYSAMFLMRWYTPLSLLALAAIAWAGPALGAYSALAWTLYCVSCTVGTLAQPAIGMAFPAHLAGRALSAFNLLIFSGVFAVQWGVGLAIDALQAQGWTQVVAYQGAMGLYGLCCLAAYVHMLRARPHN